jgi:hypothetical protein
VGSCCGRLGLDEAHAEYVTAAMAAEMHAVPQLRTPRNMAQALCRLLKTTMAPRPATQPGLDASASKVRC